MIAAIRFVLMTLALLLPAAAWADAAPPMGATHHLTLRLVAESQHPAPGRPLVLAIATTPEPGWHGYWQNPGGSGFPARFDWTLPAGARAREPAYPVPSTYLIAGIMSYVFGEPYAPLVTVDVPAGLAPGTTFPIRAHANYLVCSESLCVPETAELSLALTIGDGAVSAEDRARFDGWRQALPRPLGSAATVQANNGAVRMAVPYPAAAIAPQQPYFFPLTPQSIDTAAPQTVTRDGDRLVIETRMEAGAAAGPIAGVLRVAPGQAFRIDAQPGTVAAASGAAASPAAGSSVAVMALLAFLGAVLGGLILNIMPCVFPILSLKALSLVRGHIGVVEARREALAYTAGVVIVCLALGGAILGLRAGGSAVGWAFQLQSPHVLVVLLLLSVALALNLAGLFEFATPRFAGEASGSGGAFATGALAAFIATPCTGPFMGAALGAALVLPWPAALAVFGGLGLGLALPFLLLGFVPALRRLLPKPGGWMETFRRILSVPMWLTAIALGWVLGRQVGIDGLTIALVAALAAGLVLWLGGTRQHRGLSFGWGYAVALVAVAALGSGLAATRHAAAPAAATNGAEPFSEARLAALRTENRPVFAYFTADWCLTCKVNERTAIDTDATRNAFAANHTAVLVGDWTSGDPVLGRFIQAHNSAGVPLYLYYRPGATEPEVLPQVLTPGTLAGL